MSEWRRLPIAEAVVNELTGQRVASLPRYRLVHKDSASWKHFIDEQHRLLSSYVTRETVERTMDTAHEVR